MVKRILGLVFTLLLSTTLYAADYVDVKDDAWYKEAINYVIDNKIMSSENDYEFLPDKPINRAQVVSILYRLAGSPKIETLVEFKDVPKDAWYAIPASWANENKIVGNPGTFSPAGSVTREQLAMMIMNFSKSLHLTLPTAKNPQDAFKDAWYINEHAIESVQMMWRVGLMNGDSQYNFGPKEVVTRGEAADIFMRLHKAMAGESLTVTIPDTTPNHNALSDSQKKEQARVIAQRIANVIPKEGLSDVERVQIAAFVVHCYCSYCDYTMEGKDYATAYGVFIKGEFSCAGATRALGMVLNCMGYKWKHINENQYSHQWCELTMDGKTGYADGMIGRAGYGPHLAAQTGIVIN